ncbi:MAG TPA: hypothetical protein VIX59_15650 [Candidatus Binataceae bacterium]
MTPYGHPNTTPVTSVKDIAVRAKAYDIPGYIVDGPTLLECKTYRWEGHVVGRHRFSHSRNRC